MTLVASIFSKEIAILATDTRAMEPNGTNIHSDNYPKIAKANNVILAIYGDLEIKGLDHDILTETVRFIENGSFNNEPNNLLAHFRGMNDNLPTGCYMCYKHDKKLIHAHIDYQQDNILLLSDKTPESREGFHSFLDGYLHMNHTEVEFAEIVDEATWKNFGYSNNPAKYKGEKGLTAEKLAMSFGEGEAEPPSMPDLGSISSEQLIGFLQDIFLQSIETDHHSFHDIGGSMLYEVLHI